MNWFNVFLVVAVIVIISLLLFLLWVTYHMADAVMELLKSEQQRLLEKAAEYKRSKPWVSKD